MLQAIHYLHQVAVVDRLGLLIQAMKLVVALAALVAQAAAVQVCCELDKTTTQLVTQCQVEVVVQVEEAAVLALAQKEILERQEQVDRVAGLHLHQQVVVLQGLLQLEIIKTEPPLLTVA
jgi:hypothetical protein